MAVDVIIDAVILIDIRILFQGFVDVELSLQKTCQRRNIIAP